MCLEQLGGMDVRRIPCLITSVFFVKGLQEFFSLWREITVVVGTLKFGNILISFLNKHSGFL